MYTNIESLSYNLKLTMLYVSVCCSVSTSCLTLWDPKDCSCPGSSVPGISQARILVPFSSVAQSCPTLCDPMDCSTPGLPVHHQLLEFTQTHVNIVLLQLFLSLIQIKYIWSKLNLLFFIVQKENVDVY